MAPTVFWPSVLGLVVLGIGLWTYRKDLSLAEATLGDRIRAIGPVFIGASLAAFSGEHFSDAADLMAMVPKWLPLRLAITYFVGAGLLAAGVSLATKKLVRWSAPLLALTFGLFVALIYLPSLMRHPNVRIAWIFPFREGSYAIGAFCVFVYETRRAWSRQFGQFLRFWTAFVLVFYGTQNVLFPQYSPGVPDTRPTSAWVPMHVELAYLVGSVLILLGLGALLPKKTRKAVTAAGVFMTALTILLFEPDLILAHGALEQVTAINFVADTLLFAGTLLVMARSVASEGTRRGSSVGLTS